MSKRAILIATCFAFLAPAGLNAQAWDPDVRLTNNSALSWISYNNARCLAVSGDTVHVVWFDSRDGNEEIYYKRSIDGGTSWGSDTRLTNDGSYSEYPSVAVSGSNVHVVWYDHRDGNLEIYYKRSIDGGLTWGTDTRLTNAGSWSDSPSVAVSGSDIHVAWNDSRDGNPEIYYKRSIDGGLTWGTDTRLTNEGSYSEYPSVAVSGSNVHVVWYDERDGNLEIYYKRSIDGGINWGSDIRLTNEGFFSLNPSVAVSGSKVHVVWCDDRDRNWEIYYKRGGEMQPDNLVKNSDESDYLGDGIYNDDGTDQTSTQNIAPGDTACYHVEIENDGDVSDTITVAGTGSVDGWTVHYYDALEGGTDITSDVSGPGWSTENLDPGEYKEIRVEITPVSTSEGSSFDVLVASTSKIDDACKDVVKATTTVGTGVEEEAVPVPLVYSLDLSTLSSGKGCAIAYTLPQASNVSLSIYDVSGALVENLVDGPVPSGNHISTWKGNAGVYFVRLQTPDRVLARKLIVVN